MTPDNMLVEIGDAVVPGRYAGKKGQCPTVARPEDEVVDVVDRASVNKMNSAADNALDGSVVLDVRVVKGFVAEVTVESMSDGNRMHWSFRNFR